MQTDSPLISIIIGVHNLSPRWKNAINSLKAQTYKNWQCIICDDGSTDGSYNKWQIARNKLNEFSDVD